MHDPMVVAHEIPSPIPERVRWRERGGKRWGFDVARRTNAEDLGQRTYRWWRLRGYTLRLGGRAYGLRTAFTIWHVEPKGRDAFTVCKRGSRWKWHVHHWRVQVHYEQRLRRFLLERCEKCGRRFPWGYAPVSHSWSTPKSRWRDGVVRRSYHHECSSVGSYERMVEQDKDLIRHLIAAMRVEADCSEAEMVDRITGHGSPLDFHLRYRLTGMLGYERDDKYRLVLTSERREREEAARLARAHSGSTESTGG